MASPNISPFGTADDRTLRMSAPHVDTEALQKWLAYQEAFIGQARHLVGNANALAQAHELALKQAGLDGSQVEELSAVVRAFCGPRRVLIRLKARQKELEQQGPKAQPVLDRVIPAIERLSRTEPFAQRYGAETLALLLHQEARVVALHEQLLALSGG